MFKMVWDIESARNRSSDLTKRMCRFCTETKGRAYASVSLEDDYAFVELLNKKEAVKSGLVIGAQEPVIKLARDKRARKRKPRFGSAGRRIGAGGFK